MKKVSLAKAIQTVGRPVFTTREIALVAEGTLSTVSHGLERMAQQGVVQKVARGIWCVPSDPRFTPFWLVPYLAGGHQAYVSFLSALNLHGMIEQIPRSVFCATTGHTRLTMTPVGTFSFHRIHPNFFAGFDWYRGGRAFLIATPEKALVDSLYLSSRRGRQFRFFPEIEFGRGFRFQAAADWANRIPYARIRKYVLERLESLRRRARPGPRPGRGKHRVGSAAGAL
jgi:hypothetical protein